MATLIEMQKFKDKKFIQHKYSEIRDMAARIHAELMQLNAFLEENQLKTVKSNHRRERELAKLCQLELDAIVAHSEKIFSTIEIVEGKADVIDIKTKKKKAA